LAHFIGRPFVGMFFSRETPFMFGPPPEGQSISEQRPREPPRKTSGSVRSTDNHAEKVPRLPETAATLKSGFRSMLPLPMPISRWSDEFQAGESSLLSKCEYRRRFAEVEVVSRGRSNLATLRLKASRRSLLSRYSTGSPTASRRRVANLSGKALAAGTRSRCPLGSRRNSFTMCDT
jgi:hypothetical protein